MMFRTMIVSATVLGGLVFGLDSRQSDPPAMNNDSLKTMLDNMGYSPSSLKSGYLLVVKKDTWTYNMQLVLSGDGTKLGINANLGSVEDPSTVTADQWRTLLEKTEDVDPSAFYYDKDQKKVYLHRVLDNRSITPAILRVQIENFCSNIHDTEAAWSFTK